MSLTVTECGEWIKLTLGNYPPSPLSIATVCNQAGRHLCGMFKWRWLEGRQTTLDTVANQEYVSLPDDFAEAVSLQIDGRPGAVNWVTRDEMGELRSASSPGSTTGVKSVCISTVAQSGSTPPTQVLEISPVETSATSGYFLLSYRAGWTEVADSDEYIPIPTWMETLYIALLQAFARGFLREEQGTVGQRLMEIRAGDVYRQAVRDDRSKQTNWGRIRGGIGDEVRVDKIITTITGP